MRDFYGRQRTAQNGNSMDAPLVYQIDATVDGDTTTRYIRFYKGGEDDTKPVMVWKEVETKDGDGNVTDFTREAAMVPWEDRDSNETVYVPINECWGL